MAAHHGDVTTTVPPDGSTDAEAPPGPPPRKECSVCSTAASKYCCPGCGVRTCSLQCSVRHKQDSGCTGKRDRTAFVPLKEFDDRTLLSDYQLLEEVTRAGDVAKRVRPPFARPQLPPHLATLVQQASKRGVHLCIMPPGMQKRKANTTRYDYRSRKLRWRVEWRFPSASASGPAVAAANGTSGGHGSGSSSGSIGDGSSSKGVTLVDVCVDEGTRLDEVLQRHLQYVPGSALQQFALREYADAGLGALRIVMRKERVPANEAAWHLMYADATLGSQLAGKLVVEYPVLTVLLPSEQAAYRLAQDPPPPTQLLRGPPPPPPPPRGAPAATLVAAPAAPAQASHSEVQQLGQDRDAQHQAEQQQGIGHLSQEQGLASRNHERDAVSVLASGHSAASAAACQGQAAGQAQQHAGAAAPAVGQASASLAAYAEEDQAREAKRQRHSNGVANGGESVHAATLPLVELRPGNNGGDAISGGAIAGPGAATQQQQDENEIALDDEPPEPAMVAGHQSAVPQAAVAACVDENEVVLDDDIGAVG